MSIDEEKKERFSGLISIGNLDDLVQAAYEQGLDDMGESDCGDASSDLWRDCQFEVLEYGGHYIVTWVDDGGGCETREEARNLGRNIVASICGRERGEKP
jgi:hypothetical protein